MPSSREELSSMTNGSMAPGPPVPGPVPGPGFRVQHHPYHQQQHQQQQQQQQQYHQPNMSLTDRCAGCNAIDVPLLACDDLDGASNNKDGVPPVGDLSLRSRFCPNCMIGKKVRVFWPVDSSWYIGTVQQFDALTGEHLLKYEDDDTEWVQIGESNTTMNPSAPQVGAPPQQQQLAGGPGRASPPNETDSSSLLEKTNANINSSTNTNTMTSVPETATAIANDVTSANTTAETAIANEVTSADAPSSSYRTYGLGQHHLPPHLSHPHPHPHPHHAYSHPSSGPGGFSLHGHRPPPPSSSIGYGYPGQHSIVVPQRHGSSATGPPHHLYGGIHGHNPHRLESPSPITTTSGQIESGDNGGGIGKHRKTGPKAWTKEEDSLLLSIVQSMRVPMKWSLVAQNLPERTGKQCRERYVNHLNPRLKVADWSPTEDATIFHLYNTIGSHWAKMSKIIPGRTDNGIKNRFHNLRRQLEREDEHRLRLSAARDFPEEIRLELLREFPKELRGKAAELWDIKSGLSVLAAQSILGGGVTRTSSRFGPFRKAEVGVESCVRCGFILPSVQTGSDICTKTGWCQSCARIPPHVSGNMLRECLNLRRCQKTEKRKIIESWELPGKKKVENADKSVQ